MSNMKSPKKKGDLPRVLKEVFEILKECPTTAYVVEKTGKDKRNVSKYLNRLIKRGFIKRQKHGHYIVLKSPISEQVVAVGKEKSDYFRYHNLQIEVRLRKEDIKTICNKVIRNMEHKDNPNGLYFNYLLTGLISNDSLYLYFPKNWDVIADDMDSLMVKVYNEIMDILYKWSNKFKVGLFKDGRVNFNIRNQHIAICKNGVVKEFKNKKITDLVIYDKDDGKARFLMDFSKGIAELEAVHPQKATDDIQEAKFFMETLKEGRYRKLFESGSDFFDKSGLTLSQIEEKIEEVASLLSLTAKTQLNTANMLHSVVERQTPLPHPDDKSLADYFG